MPVGAERSSAASGWPAIPPALPACNGLRRCQQILAAPLAELSHALWCWAVCGKWAGALTGSAEDQVRRAWLEELLAAYVQVERQLHLLMRRPPEVQSIAALQPSVAGLGLRLDGLSPASNFGRT